MSLLEIRLVIAIVIALAGALIPMAALATPEAEPFYRQRHFFDQNQQGYWWYRLDPPPEEQPPQEIKPQPAATPAPSQQETKTEPPRLDLPEEQTRKAMQSLMEDPTLEKAEAFLRWQDWMFKRAEKVAMLFQQVILLHPELNPDVEEAMPVSSKGLEIGRRMRDEQNKVSLDAIGKDMAILFFFRSTCNFCQAEYPIMQQLRRRGLVVQPVSIDGPALPSMPPNDAVYDESGKMSDLFSVSRVPTMVVVDPKKNVTAVIGVGYTTEDVLIERLTAFYEEMYPRANDAMDRLPKPSKMFIPPIKPTTPGTPTFR